jgi:hypothetical protein
MGGLSLSRNAARQLQEVVRQSLYDTKEPPQKPESRTRSPLAVYIAKPDADISGLTNSTPGSGTASIYKVNTTGVLEDREYDKTVYNLSAGTITNGSYVACVQELASGKLVVCSTDTNFRIAKSTVQIPARVGSVPGSASVQPQKIDSGLLVDDGDPVTVYSWVKYASQTPAPSFYLAMTRDRNGIWWFTGEDCP